MNSPVTEEDENGYVGSEPLDPALADRFAFVVAMPGWALFDDEEQIAVIRGDDGTISAEAADRLRRCIASARAVLLRDRRKALPLRPGGDLRLR